MIDLIEHQMQERLEQLRIEAEELRRALVALEPQRNDVIDRIRRAIQGRLAQVLTEAEGLDRMLLALEPPEPPAGPRAPAHRTPRAAPGETKSKVLAALADGTAMTAGDVASSIGLGRGTVSSTLSRLLNSGAVLKVARGYRLPGPRDDDRAPTAPAAPPAATLPISVIVPTRNAVEWIDACLTGIELNRPAEVIVVDGDSQDGTREIALDRADRVLDDHGAGIGAARQLGVEATTQRWVALVDADVVIGPGVLEALLAEAQERRLVGLQAQLFSVGGGEYWSRQLARHHNRGLVRDWFGVSATIIRRDILLTHPFDPSLRSGEDIDLRLRLRAAGVPVGVSQRTQVVHRFSAGYAFCRDQWLVDGQGLGRMVRSHGARAVPNALIPFPAAALGMLEAFADRLRPLPYFAGFAVVNWMGLLRGLRDGRVPIPTTARRMLTVAMSVLIASLVVLAPAAILATGLGGGLLMGAAYDGAGWTTAISVAGLGALTAVEFTGHAALGAARRVAQSAAWLLSIAGLVCAAVRLLGVTSS